MVTINGVTYTYIIDTEFDEGDVELGSPEWINDNTPEFGSVWSRGRRAITYTLRCTNAQKWALDQLITGCSAITLVDSLYGFNGSVWASKIEAEWDAQTNYAYPWKIVLTLIPIVT